MLFSGDWLFASLLVSSVGGGFFLYGKKQSRLPQLLCGLALIAESMFVASLGWMLGLAAATVIALVAVVRAGL